ncbi:unnamed protein product [Ranitomeya imitator]|uniref:Uncharacterized protein n=1 Tax=Ranitomeya imitator TaxID=111125 RepID=A0ABN9LT73_9NEOB|nr:unnamed protein product [Ranitomeya imitator]
MRPPFWNMAAPGGKKTDGPRQDRICVTGRIGTDFHDAYAVSQVGKGLRGVLLTVEDVKKRWRSVTDRLIKAESGSSPSKKRVPFADQLQFILTSRNLRRTEGNVRAETPPVHEDNSPEHGDGEKVEDYPMCSLPNPPLPRQSSSMHAAVMPPSCTVASSSSAVDAAVVSSAVVAASASSSFVGGSRPTGLGAGSARPVPMVRAAPRKGKKRRVRLVPLKLY